MKRNTDQLVWADGESPPADLVAALERAVQHGQADYVDGKVLQLVEMPTDRAGEPLFELASFAVPPDGRVLWVGVSKRPNKPPVEWRPLMRTDPRAVGNHRFTFTEARPYLGHLLGSQNAALESAFGRTELQAYFDPRTLPEVRIESLDHIVKQSLLGWSVPYVFFGQYRGLWMVLARFQQAAQIATRPAKARRHPTAPDIATI